MKLSFFPILIIICIVGCTTPKTAIDYDRSFDFTTIKSYQFENQALDISELDSARLYNAIENNLKSKGLTPNQNPDVIINIQPNEYVSQDSNSTVGVGVGGGRGVFGGGISVGIPIKGKQKWNQDYKISFNQFSNNQLIWEGILSLSWSLNATPAQREIKIKEGVEKLLMEYPPAKK